MQCHLYCNVTLGYKAICWLQLIALLVPFHGIVVNPN